MLTVLTAVGCGLIAGVFFAFSTVVMKALARLPPAHGIAARQSINVVVLNPMFLGAFLGTAAGCLVLAVAAALPAASKPGTGYILGGNALYLAGTVLVTRVFHIPRNDTLAALDLMSPDATRVWESYLKSWTAWNHVRTASALAAAASLTLAIR